MKQTIKTMMAMLLLMTSLTTFAGSGGGNGGCSQCIESYGMGVELAAELLILGQGVVQKKVPLIKNVEDLYRVAESRRVEPGSEDQLNQRDAISYAETQTTLIDVKKFSKLSRHQKVKI